MSNTAVFDSTFYLTNNADVVVAISQGHFANALDHYTQFGGKELRAPNSTFDASYYAINNSDVLSAVSAGGLPNVFSHYQQFGETENRAPSAQFANFDATGYLAANTDVAAAITAGAFSSALDHFIAFGQNETRTGSGITAGGTAGAGGSTFVLGNSTTTFDNIVGTGSGDTITGGPNSLQTGDVIDGGDGNDVLNVTLAGTATTPVIANVENINFTTLANTNVTTSGISAATNGTTINATQGTGLTTTLTSLNETVSLGMSGAGGLTVASLVSDDTVDAVNLTVTGTVGVFTDTSSHIDTLNITAGSDAATKVTVGAGTIDSVNATEAATYTAAGDLIVEDTAVNSQFTAKRIDATGVTGTFTLELDADTTAAANETISLANFTGLDRMLFSQDQSANNLVITNAKSGLLLEINDNNANAHAAGNVTLDNTALTGDSDSITVQLGGDGDATGIAGNLAVAGFETVNLHGATTGTTTTDTYTVGGTIVQSTSTVDRTEKLVITGEVNMTVTGAITSDVVDGSGMTKTLTLTAGTAVAGGLMQGGSAADTLDQTANIATVVQGNGGGDTIDLDNGTASNVVRYASINDGASAGADTGGDAVTKIDLAAGNATDDIFHIIGDLRTALDDGTTNGTLTFKTSTGGGNDAVASTDEALFVRENEALATQTASNIAAHLNTHFALSNFSTAGSDLFFVVNTANTTETFTYGVYTESGTGAEAQASEITILGVGTANADATNLATADFVFA